MTLIVIMDRVRVGCRFRFRFRFRVRVSVRVRVRNEAALWHGLDDDLGRLVVVK